MALNADEKFALAFMKHMVLAENKTKENLKPESEKPAKKGFSDDILKLKEKLKSKIAETKIEKLKDFTIEEKAKKLRDITIEEEKEEKFEPRAYTYELHVPKPPTRSVAVPKPPKEILNKPSENLGSFDFIALDLNELNKFIKDEEVTSIQCEGPDTYIKIAKENDIVETNIKLDEDKINKIIKKFSARSQRALTEPVFKAKVGNLTLMAIISKSTGTKFMILKE